MKRTNKHTDKLFFSYDPPYSRGNKEYIERKRFAYRFLVAGRKGLNFN